MSIIPIPDAFPVECATEDLLMYGPIGEWGKKILSDFYAKEEWNSKGMYAFVCWQWVNPLAEFLGKSKVLEVMAGAGWLARALREKGVDVIATDSFKWITQRGWSLQTKVEMLSAVAAIQKYGKDCQYLIISWPYMDRHAYYAIKEMHKVNPATRIIYIGEPEGGCTADQKFFEHFEEIEDEAFQKVAAKYRTWDTLHDHMSIGKFKP